MKWTHKEKKEIEKYLKAGKTFKYIADKMNKSKSSVYIYAYRNCKNLISIKPKTNVGWSDVEIWHLYKYYKKDSIKNLCADLNRSKHSIHQKIKELNLKILDIPEDETEEISITITSIQAAYIRSLHDPSHFFKKLLYQNMLEVYKKKEEEEEGN